MDLSAYSAQKNALEFYAFPLLIFEFSRQNPMFSFCEVFVLAFHL